MVKLFQLSCFERKMAYLRILNASLTSDMYSCLCSPISCEKDKGIPNSRSSPLSHTKLMRSLGVSPNDSGLSWTSSLATPSLGREQPVGKSFGRSKELVARPMYRSLYHFIVLILIIHVL